jgi:hypothetical protein
MQNSTRVFVKKPPNLMSFLDAMDIVFRYGAEANPVRCAILQPCIGELKTRSPKKGDAHATIRTLFRFRCAIHR